MAANFPPNGGGSGGGAVDSVNGKTGTVVLGKTDIGLGSVDNTSDASKPISTATQQALDGKEASGTAAAAMSAHTGATDPHSQYLPKAGGTMSGAISFAPAQTWPTFNQSTTGNSGTATKLATARTINGVSFDGSANITINAVDSTAREPSITAGTTSQYWRGDKSWRDFFTDVRAATLTGLSTATNAVIGATDTVLGALGKLQKQVSDNLTTLTSHTSNNSNPHSVTKAQVGLGNVDNTSDASKPVSIAVQTALNAKQDTLVSGTNIKTVNSQSILGEGNIVAGLSNFTESISTSSPNNTTSAIALTTSGAATNIDFCMVAKGAGALLAQVPDGAATGGNKRGQYATDFQHTRSAATQVASGDYSVISGGEKNTARGSQSVIGGGSANTAGGGQSVIGGGNSNTAGGSQSVIGGGAGNTASGSYSVISGGYLNTAGGSQSVIGGGSWNTANGYVSTIPGGYCATANGITGVLAYGFYGEVLGQNQMSFWGGRLDTSTATPTRITADAGAASATNQLTLRNNSAFRVRGTVVARDTSANNCKEWTFETLIKRGANAAATAIVGTPSITSTFADTSASGWALAITADTTNGALAITGTGAASTTIRWTAVVHSIEVA